MDDDSSLESKDGILSQTPGSDSPSTGRKSEDEGGRSKSFLPPWSGALWQDGSRKSAFQPYRVQPTTVLTNLQRGNIQTLTPVLEPLDVSIHHRAGQGEVTDDDLLEADIDEEDSCGMTPLHWAAFYGQLPTVHFLLQKGAIVDKEGKEGETALQLAAAGGHHDTMKVLLAEGANINHIDENSNTALMYAAHGDHPHCVNELLMRGADLTLKNINNDSALGIAINKSSSQAQAVIENHVISLLSLGR